MNPWTPRGPSLLIWAPIRSLRFPSRTPLKEMTRCVARPPPTPHPRPLLGFPLCGKLILKANKSGRLNCISQSATPAASAGRLGCFDRLQMLHLRKRRGCTSTAHHGGDSKWRWHHGDRSEQREEGRLLAGGFGGYVRVLRREDTLLEW